jgi:hypothetical protein
VDDRASLADVLDDHDDVVARTLDARDRGAVRREIARVASDAVRGDRDRHRSRLELGSAPMPSELRVVRRSVGHREAFARGCARGIGRQRQIVHDAEEVGSIGRRIG